MDGDRGGEMGCMGSIYPGEGEGRGQSSDAEAQPGAVLCRQCPLSAAFLLALEQRERGFLPCFSSRLAGSVESHTRFRPQHSSWSWPRGKECSPSASAQA